MPITPFGQTTFQLRHISALFDVFRLLLTEVRNCQTAQLYLLRFKKSLKVVHSNSLHASVPCDQALIPRESCARTCKGNCTFKASSATRSIVFTVHSFYFPNKRFAACYAVRCPQSGHKQGREDALEFSLTLVGVRGINLGHFRGIP